MPEVSKSRSVWKKILDSKFAWDKWQAPTYNKLIGHAAAEIYNEISQTFEPPENAVVLDVGSGPGLSTLMVARQYPTISITGIDYSETMVNAAKQNMIGQGVTNCTFTLGDAMDIPFPDDHFDMVISIASIKHWPDGVKGLREIRRVLKSGGKAQIGEALRDAPEKDLMRFVTLFAENFPIKFLMVWYVKKVVFGMSYSCEEAEQMAKEAGFSNVKVEKTPDWPFLDLTLTS